MTALVGHLSQICKIAKKHSVPRSWFQNDYDESLRQLIRDTSVIYPEWLLRKDPFSRVRPHSLGLESQLEIFDAITKEFSRRKIKNNKLAYELTALICSPPASVQNKILEPNPEAVRTNVRDRRRKKT
jgi:hypothetical protein